MLRTTVEPLLFISRSLVKIDGVTKEPNSSPQIFSYNEKHDLHLPHNYDEVR